MDAKISETVTVFGQKGVYAGWPANHGAWQWGDEFLVGFIVGHHNIGGMHNVKGELKKVLARSLNGGLTWRVEVPNVDFEAKTVREPPPYFNLKDSIIRVCGVYDHGGEHCDRQGGFYLSKDRGRTWEGAYAFKGVELLTGQINTSRTCVLDNLVFLSAADQNHWGSDRTFCTRVEYGAFFTHSIVLDDHARAVMPAAAKISDRIVVVLRRRGTSRPGGWIDSVYSDDGGLTWSTPFHVADTGIDNGNPPALIEHGGKLYCAYGNRTMQGIFVAVSDDGEVWHHYATLRTGNESDIGYPRLFKRSDGRMVCVYYWADSFEEPQRIEATVFSG